MFKTILFFIFVSLAFAEDYYELLGLHRGVDQREIRKAFKKLAITKHPDKNQDDPEAHEKFVKLTTAYEVLKDPDLRKKYDLYGEAGLDNNKGYTKYHSYSYYQHNFGIYDDDPQIVTLSRTDFFDSVVESEKMWFINFYSPMCSHCHHLAPIWRKIAKELEGVIRIGAVNCEDDWSLCSEIGIKSYPSLLYYRKNSNRGTKYGGDKSKEAMIQFVLEKIDANIRSMTNSAWKMLLKGKNSVTKPTLVFVCGESLNCFTPDDRLKVAAIFEKIVDVKLLKCKNDEKCAETGVAYVPFYNESTVAKPILFEDVDEIEDLVKKVLDQLPEPKDINDAEFHDILEKLNLKENENGWLLCFYIGHARELDVLLKQLPSLTDVNLAKINCGRYPYICENYHINRYPSWGVLKRGGAFEINHGKDSLNDLANFAKSSIKAENVWRLSADQIKDILKRDTGEAWFLDWYSPRCPPCLKFLREVRKASLHFDSSKIRFGTIDCTIHVGICNENNIRSYPTGMIINGTRTHYFNMNKVASNLINFVYESMNPSVFQITSSNFQKTLGGKKNNELWAVDYYASWCGPCQHLMPEWTIVAKTMHNLPFVKIAGVDCAIEKDLCQSQRINSYPTIRLYLMQSEGLNSVATYSGERDNLSIMKWISHFLPVKVQDLSDKNIQSVFKKNDVVLIDYYSPRCGHCHILEPQYAVAAQLLKGKVHFARINCDSHYQFCNNAGIRSYPTMLLYIDENVNRLSYGIKIQSDDAGSIVSEIKKVLLTKNVHFRDEL